MQSSGDRQFCHDQVNSRSVHAYTLVETDSGQPDDQLRGFRNETKTKKRRNMPRQPPTSPDIGGRDDSLGEDDIFSQLPTGVYASGTRQSSHQGNPHWPCAMGPCSRKLPLVKIADLVLLDRIDRLVVLSCGCCRDVGQGTAVRAFHRSGPVHGDELQG